MKTGKILTITALIMLLCTYVHAQLDITVSKAEMQCSGQDKATKIINVTFSKSLSGLLIDAENKVRRAGNDKEFYQKKLDALAASIEKLSPGAGTKMESLYLLSLEGKMTPLTAINGLTVKITGTDKKYYDAPDTVAYKLPSNFVIDSKYVFMMATAASTPSIVSVDVSSNCTEALQKLPDPTYQPEKKKAKAFDEIVMTVEAKDEAVVFADMAYDSRKKNNADDDKTHSFTGNLSFVPVRIKKIGFAGNYEIQPFFYDLKINDKGDENSYISNFGARIRYIRVFGDDGEGFNNNRSNRFLPGLVTDLTAKIETNDFFDGVNLVGEIKPILPINVYQSRARVLRFDPYIGYTLGKKLKDSTRKETQLPRGTLSRLDWINRPMAGFELTYTEFRDRIIKPTLTFSYVIRWPLQAEDYYAKSAGNSNTDIFVGASRLPRKYYNTRLSLDMGTIITPFIAYESGRLPPDYKFINGQMKIGFSVKFKAK